MNGLWYIWMILGALLIVGEMFTAGFVLLWFGIGALVAGLLALTGVVTLPFQVLIFLVVSIGLTIASRTILERFLLKGSQTPELKSGVDSLPGRTGIVVESSAGATGEGAVKVFGSTWRAFPAEGESPLLEGQQVRIDRVEGASVYVRHIDSEASWRVGARISD
jgi:membrane protein implicated in regulation of membrane protease activity